MRRKTRGMQVAELVFLGEQDGPPERKLKKQLAEFFLSNSAVKSAYLARIAYGSHSAPLVALCVRTESGQDQTLVENAGKIFASMFGRDEHMDIVFLDERQETELLRVCRAFFVGSVAN